ncbi:MAG: hypothetical protein KKB37_15815, partial [Alphaproteobacteria bacterium]|nr:hypothetical protein [Alphaproteobacteria bacterium]
KYLNASSLLQRAVVGLLILSTFIVASVLLYGANHRANATMDDRNDANAQLVIPAGLKLPRP